MRPLRRSEPPRRTVTLPFLVPNFFLFSLAEMRRDWAQPGLLALGALGTI